MAFASTFLVMQNQTNTSSTSNGFKDDGGALSFIITTCIGIIGCFIAVLVLGKEFCTGKTSTLVIVASLTLVDFVGIVSTSSLVFRGLIEGNGWIAQYPQCQLQAFFTCTFCISSGCIVTFMAIDRTVSLYKPFFYKMASSPDLARAVCISTVFFCGFISSLPFMGFGNYIVSQSAVYVCHYDWYSKKPKDKFFVLILGLLAAIVIVAMLVSNLIVFTLVWKLKQNACKIVPSQMKTSSRRKCIAAKKEQQMAEFVASVSLIFLATWLPLTIRFFCHFFEVLPSPKADLIANKMAACGMVANPFTYVIFRSIFKRTLRKRVSAVQNSFSHKMFSKARMQYPENTSIGFDNRGGRYTSRIVSDIMDPRFVNRQSVVALESIAS